MIMRTAALLLAIILTAVPALAGDQPATPDQWDVKIDARLQAIDRSARDNGHLALKLYKYRRTLAREAAFVSNATVADHLKTRLDGISDQIRQAAEPRTSSLAMYVHAHDLYSRGQEAEAAPTPRGEDSERLYGEAAKWLKLSLDHAPSAVLLGHLYQEGKGVPRSGHAAVDHYYDAGALFLAQGETDRALAMLDLMESVDPAHPKAARLYAMIQAREKTGAVRNRGGMGTGFVCGPGFVATAWHVVQGAKSIQVRTGNGRSVPARLAALSADNDLALLVADFGSPPPAIPLASDAPKMGAEVFTIGFPDPGLMGASPRVTGGRISALTGLGDNPGAYQISVPVQPGNSGGPLLNMRGEVVGVVASTLSAAKMFRWTGTMPQNVNFAIKSVRLENLLAMAKTQPNGRSRPFGTGAASLETLVERLRPSVVLVIAK